MYLATCPNRFSIRSGETGFRRRIFAFTYTAAIAAVTINTRPIGGRSSNAESTAAKKKLFSRDWVEKRFGQVDRFLINCFLSESNKKIRI